MNKHLENFLEAMVFGDECEVDTSRLRADAEKIIAEFLISCALAITNYDAQEPDEDADDYQSFGEGCAAFNLGMMVLFGEALDRFDNWPTLRAYVDKITKEYMA